MIKYVTSNRGALTYRRAGPGFAFAWEDGKNWVRATTPMVHSEASLQIVELCFLALFGREEDANSLDQSEGAYSRSWAYELGYAGHPGIRHKIIKKKKEKKK